MPKSQGFLFQLFFWPENPIWSSACPEKLFAGPNFQFFLQQLMSPDVRTDGEEFPRDPAHHRSPTAAGHAGESYTVRWPLRSPHSNVRRFLVCTKNGFIQKNGHEEALNGHRKGLIPLSEVMTFSSGSVDKPGSWCAALLSLRNP